MTHSEDIVTAIINKDVATLESILSKNPEMVREKYSFPQTELESDKQYTQTYLAFALDQNPQSLEIVQTLVKYKIDINESIYGTYGFNDYFDPHKLDEKIFVYLLKSGLKIDERESALEMAIERKYSTETFKLIFELIDEQKININKFQDHDGHVIFMDAISEEKISIEVLELFLDRNVYVNERYTGAYPYTLLECAIMSKRDFSDIKRLILRGLPVYTDSEDDDETGQRLIEFTIQQRGKDSPVTKYISNMIL